MSNYWRRWAGAVIQDAYKWNQSVSPRVPLVEVLMITNHGYWLLMVKDELSERLKLIKHQMKIIQAKDDNDVVFKALGSEVHSS